MSELKFFNEKQFVTLTKAIEVIIDTGGHDAITPDQAAHRIDEMLFQSKSPALDRIPQLFNLLEWAVPPLVLKFPPFSKLSPTSRKAVIDRVKGNKGMFRDLARALKAMSCVSYYSSPQGMKQVGFIPFEERTRFATLHSNLIEHQNNS